VYLRSASTKKFRGIATAFKKLKSSHTSIESTHQPSKVPMVNMQKWMTDSQW